MKIMSNKHVLQNAAKERRQVSNKPSQFTEWRNSMALQLLILVKRKRERAAQFQKWLWLFQWILHPPFVASSSSSTIPSENDTLRREPVATERLWQREFMVHFYADDSAGMHLWLMAEASNSNLYESTRQIYSNKQHFMETEHGDEGLRLLKVCYQVELVKQEDIGHCPKITQLQNLTFSSQWREKKKPSLR